MMKTLIVKKNGALEVVDIHIPPYNECQALVKTIACGICNGTDAKLIHRKFKNVGPDEYPLMLGHEGVGRVVEIGAKVTTFKVGDIVLLPFVDPQDGYHSAWGAYSEYGVVCDPAAWDEDKYGPTPECAFGQNVVPPSIDPVDASMIITLREVLSSIKRFGIGAGQSVVVFGCGPVGTTFIQLMSLLGVHPIIAVDVVAEKLEHAKAVGADYTLLNDAATLADAVCAHCPDGAQFVLDAVGISALINQAMPLLADQGKICCYGISANLSETIDWTDAPYNWGLQFQQFPSKIEEGLAYPQILEWLETGAIRLQDYISDYFEFEDILTAFEKLEKRQIAGKGIVRYQG